MQSVEWRLARLEAAEAIRQAVYAYAMAGDRGNDAHIVRTLFSEDATYEAKGMGRFEGLDNIVRGLAQIARDVVVWSFHAPGGPWIDLAEDGGQARVFWWVWVPVALRSEDGTTTPHWGAGHYNGAMRCDWPRHTRIIEITRKIVAAVRNNPLPKLLLLSSAIASSTF